MISHILCVYSFWSDLPEYSWQGMMRKAAFDAGMIWSENSDRLRLCLEPEAACMACEDQGILEQGDQNAGI